jgi:sporulation protein YunB
MLNRKSKSKRGGTLIIVGLCLIIAAVLADIRVRPIIRAAGEYQCSVVAARLISVAVEDEIAEYDYSALVKLSRDENGSIVSVESNMVSINRLKTRVTEQVNIALSAIESSDLAIPLGTVSGVQLLYGRGVGIPVRLTPRGYAAVNLTSEFSTAGINQTLHRITLHVSADIAAIIPGYTSGVNVVTEFVVAQTVIVGYVPESYTHIILN